MNCTWKREFLFNDYATSCGKSYWFGVDVTPKEKGFEYCPFCGYPLVTPNSAETVAADGGEH